MFRLADADFHARETMSLQGLYTGIYHCVNVDYALHHQHRHPLNIGKMFSTLSIFLFSDIIPMYIQALIPFFHMSLKADRNEGFRLLPQPTSDLVGNVFVIFETETTQVIFQGSKKMEITGG